MCPHQKWRKRSTPWTPGTTSLSGFSSIFKALFRRRTFYEPNLIRIKADPDLKFDRRKMVQLLAKYVSNSFGTWKVRRLNQSPSKVAAKAGLGERGVANWFRRRNFHVLNSMSRFGSCGIRFKILILIPENKKPLLARWCGYHWQMRKLCKRSINRMTEHPGEHAGLLQDPSPRARIEGACALNASLGRVSVDMLADIYIGQLFVDVSGNVITVLGGRIPMGRRRIDWYADQSCWLVW